MFRPIILLGFSNLFMTFAWYGHLKNMSHKPLIFAILASWVIAFFEYVLFKVNVKTNVKVKCPGCGQTTEIHPEQAAPGMDMDVQCPCGNTVKLKPEHLRKIEKVEQKVGWLEKIFGKKNGPPHP